MADKGDNYCSCGNYIISWRSVHLAMCCPTLSLQYCINRTFAHDPCMTHQWYTLGNTCLDQWFYTAFQQFFNYINPFPHIDAFWRLCSRRLFENIVTKEEIAQNVQFLLLLQCFPLFVIGYPFKYGDFLCFDKIRSKSSAAELSYEVRVISLPFLGKLPVLLVHLSWHPVSQSSC